VEKKWLFDRQWTRDFTVLRQKFVAEFLANVQPRISPGSALDVGCGVGDFSKFLADVGFRVVAIDGREENASEARKRYPHITFFTQNAEELSSSALGTFDLVLCFGLLYHLENPFRAIRQLYAATGKILFIESMCAPNSQPMMELLDEGVAEDQGLNYVAFYPSESCLVKMLYRTGFPFVYRFENLPRDILYTETIWQKRMRTLLVASRMELSAPNLVLATPTLRWVYDTSGSWSTRLSRARDLGRARINSIRDFAARLLRPFRKKLHSASSSDNVTK
jgi:SAM-dependent methyltransferase